MNELSINDFGEILKEEVYKHNHIKINPFKHVHNHYLSKGDVCFKHDHNQQLFKDNACFKHSHNQQLYELN